MRNEYFRDFLYSVFLLNVVLRLKFLGLALSWLMAGGYAVFLAGDDLMKLDGARQGSLIYWHRICRRASAAYPRNGIGSNVTAVGKRAMVLLADATPACDWK